MMNHPSLRGGSPYSDDLEEEMAYKRAGQQRPSGPGRRLWLGWLWLTSPSPDYFGTDLAGEERLRRSQVLSVLCLVVLAALGLVVPSAIIQPRSWLTVGVMAAFCLVAALLNRSGKITLAGLTFVVLVDVAVTTTILHNPQGLSSQTPATITVYLLAILCAGVILSRQWVVWTGILQVGIILVLFARVPYDATLQPIIKNNAGLVYPILVSPLVLIVCATAIVWLYSTSVQRTLLRASRAEELAEAQGRLHEQARQIAEQNQRLEQGIGMLQEVHARLANGEYAARVNLQGNELLPLGVSLNLLAERLGRGGRIQHEYQRLEEAIQQLIKACAAVAQGNFPVTLAPTGTPVDQAASFLAWVEQLVSHMAQGSTMAEDLQTVLQHQEGYLAQAESSLFGLRSLVNTTMGNTTELRSTYRSGPMGDRLTQDQQEPALQRLRALLEEEQALCERLTQECTQAHQLGRRCIQGTRMLSLQLKEALGSRSAGGRSSGQL